MERLVPIARGDHNKVVDVDHSRKFLTNGKRLLKATTPPTASGRDASAAMSRAPVGSSCAPLPLPVAHTYPTSGPRKRAPSICGKGCRQSEGTRRGRANPSDDGLHLASCRAARAGSPAARCRRSRGRPASLHRLRAHAPHRRARPLVWKPARPGPWHRLRALPDPAPRGSGGDGDRAPLRARSRCSSDRPRRLGWPRPGWAPSRLAGPCTP
jgi:hypothetical protein